MDTPLIHLEKYQVTDYDLFRTLVADDVLMQYITGKGLTAAAATEKFKSILSVNTQENRLGYFKILNQNEEFLGDCKLVWNQYERCVLEIGYILKLENWNKGIGTAACLKLLKIAKDYYSQTDLIGIIDPDNRASKKLLVKLGFESYFVGMEDNLPTEKLILKREYSK